MGVLSEEEKAAIRLRVQIAHLQKQLGSAPAGTARQTAQRLLTKSALAAVRSADMGRRQAGRSYAVGIGVKSAKQLAGTITDGEQAISGYLACWAEDTSGDVIDPHAFDQTLADLKALQQRTNARFLMPLLAGHDMSKPVGGVLSAVPDATGLFIQAIIDTTTDVGSDCWAMIAHGYGTGLSIGYVCEKSQYDNMGRRVILQAILFEASCTPLPMNQLAVITALH